MINISPTLRELKEQDYILLIMNCKKYDYKSALQKEGWLKKLPHYLPYYHVVGDINLGSIYKFDEDAQILYVRTEDDYVSLPKKVVAAYAAIRETYKFKYIFKTDDDQNLLDPTLFDNIIGQFKEKYLKMKAHYGGQLIKVEIPYMSKYFLIHPELPTDLIVQKTDYCTGRFYFLSSEAVTNIVSKREKIERECLEDYAIGLHLNPIFKKVVLQIESDAIFKDFIFDDV